MSLYHRISKHLAESESAEPAVACYDIVTPKLEDSVIDKLTTEYISQNIACDDDGDSNVWVGFTNKNAYNRRGMAAFTKQLDQLGIQHEKRVNAFCTLLAQPVTKSFNDNEVDAISCLEDSVLLDLASDKYSKVERTSRLKELTH